MRTKEKIYLGHPNLKRLLSSVPFNNFLSDKYQTNSGLEWYDAIAEALAKLLRADTGADKIKGAFQQSKLCTAEVAKQIITLVEIYEDTESSKTVSWKNYNLFYKEEGRTFKKHFRQFMLQQSKEQLPETSLKGVWTVYSIRHGALYRSFLDINFRKELHIFHLMSNKRGRLTYCDIDSRKNNRSIAIKGDLEGTLWEYEVNGRFDTILDGRVNLIRGMVTITHEDQLGICPIILWRNNECEQEIEDLPDTAWGKIKNFENLVPGAEDIEKSLLIYYRYLIENAENVYDPRPAENLNGWIMRYLKKRGRTKYNIYSQALQGTQWVSLCRQSNNPERIRIFYWSFDFHPLKQAIIVKRVLKEGEYSEIVFMGEMKFHNDRFWIEFDSGDRHKVMMLQSTGNAYPNLYFLAMGSAGFINFVNDPGDMLTEIVVPADHLPKAYYGRESLSYHEYRTLSSIPLDLRLYLNHRDHSILSFDNPNSIKSSLQKQMEASAYKGKYHVYAYHRYLDEAYRLIRFTLEIDQLAVATLKKVHADEPDSIHTYNGLAEEGHNNLHIALEHIEQAHATFHKRARQEARLMVDTSEGHKDRAVMTGIVSDADREGNPMSLPCILVRVDNYEEDFKEYKKRFENLVAPGQTKSIPDPRAHCLNDSEEYKLLEDLLWSRQKTFLEKRFPHQFHEQKPERERFLDTYFDMIGGVFYTDYSKENRKIQKVMNQRLDELMLD